MEALFRERARVPPRCWTAAAAGTVGAFEGAMYEPRLLPPAERLHHVHPQPGPFCAVCRRAIERVIDLYARGAPDAGPDETLNRAAIRGISTVRESVCRA